MSTNGAPPLPPVVQAPLTLRRRSEVMGEIVAPRLNQEALAEWIAVKSSPDRKSQQCCHFILSTRGDKREVITQESVAKSLKEPDRSDAIAAVVAEFAEASRGWADESQHVSSFVVGACFEDSDETEEKYLWPFRISPSPGSRFATQDEFGASLTGGKFGTYGGDTEKFGAICRVLDTTIKGALTGVQQDKDRFQEREDKILERLDRIEADRFSRTLQLEELLNAKVTRDMDALERKIEIAQRERLYQMAEQIVVPLAHRVLEKKGLLAPQVAENPLLTLVKSMTPEQIFSLYQTFGQTQREVLIQLVPQLAMAMSDEQKSHLHALFTAGAMPQIEAVEAVAPKAEAKGETA